MQQLYRIINSINTEEIIGDQAREISSITIDSRKVINGSLFVAIKGSKLDGHLFIPDVINQGATAIVCASLPAQLVEGITYIKVKNTSSSLGYIASAFYDYPSTKLKLVGVTGTNGKTTVATLLYSLFMNAGFNTGLISTVENRINNQIIPSTHTTPDAVSLNALLAMMADNHCEYAFMECSSHAISQDRIGGLSFSGALFTNLTHDHLDYHKTFSAYRDAKKKFFDSLDDSAFAIINKDDKNGSVMIQNTKASCYTYSMNTKADFRVKIMDQDFNGMLLNIDNTEVWVQLTGEFNAYNLCLVYATAFLLGLKRENLVIAISSLKPVRGRFDHLESKSKVTAIIDYAHTPDALKNVLTTINKIRTNNEKLITVVGCGGDRDKSKRPIMARVASELSSLVLLTSDNPRTENPETILDEMMAGVLSENFKKVIRITDRSAAIKSAVTMAKPGDIILIAGKGHENYQEIMGSKFPFDDKAEVKNCFEMISG